MPVKFIRQYSIYNPNDIVAFDADMAQKLIAAGIATLWAPERPPVTSKMIKK